jgi:glucokinase
MTKTLWSVGVDLGGTKVEAAHVDADGHLQRRLRRPTDVKDGPQAVKLEIVDAVRELVEGAGSPPAGVGVGVAGQIEAGSGVVRFAPNLDWHDVPFQADLGAALGLPVVVTNDVRAAAWGEWLHGAGRGCDDLVCLFVGTGIGGGVVSGGQMLSGCSNTAGELGHMVVDLGGPTCHCGNRGCLEALAGGWAIARRAREPATEWVDRIEKGVRQRALAAAQAPLEVLPAQLHNDAGVVGAAALAMHLVTERLRTVDHS